MFTANDLFTALDAGVSIETVAKVLFSAGPRTLHPLSPVFQGEDARGLTASELAAKEFLVGEVAELFTTKHGKAHTEIMSYIVQLASLPCAITFVPGSAIDAVEEKCREGEPFILFARNMLYHLMSNNGTSALSHIKEYTTANARLLLKEIPKGTLLVVGGTDLGSNIFLTLNDLGFNKLHGTRSGQLFMKNR